MTRPEILLHEIKTAFNYQMLLRLKMEKASTQKYRKELQREINASCKWLQSLDAKLTNHIEREKAKEEQELFKLEQELAACNNSVYQFKKAS